MLYLKDNNYKAKLSLIGIIVLFFSFSNGLPFVSAKDLELPCTITTYDDAWEGALAFGLSQHNPNRIHQKIHNYLVLMDTNGNIHYIRDSQRQAYNIVNLVDQDTLLFTGEPKAAVNLLDLETKKVNALSQRWGHHDVIYNPQTETILTIGKDREEVNGIIYSHDTIVEYDSDQNIVWSWSTVGHFTSDMACPYPSGAQVGENTVDFTHCNSIDWDMENNIIYFNIRNLNTFCKINKTSEELLWSLGEFGDFTLLDKEGSPVPSLWYHGHSVEQVEPNVFLLFDNDLHNKTGVQFNRSRILEVTADEASMTAWVSWSWTAPREKYSGYWGDADLLPNGNRLGIFGTPHHDIENSRGAWLVEVNPAGDVVREYDFPYGWGMYRCEFIDVLSIFDQPSFSTYPDMVNEPVTIIYPSDALEKARDCQPASYCDWSVATILLSRLENVTETLDKDVLVVNQTDGSLLLESGASVITVGGPLVNPVVSYYESNEAPSYDSSPVKCVIVDDWFEFQTKDEMPIIGMNYGDVDYGVDYFVIEMFRDGRGRNVCIFYGFGWKGTFAAGKYFDRNFDSLISGEESWIIGQWVDTNLDGFVNCPEDGDLYHLIASG